jgi:hypothetical protein
MTKIKSGRYTASEQRGTPGHCSLAQVFGPDGRSVLGVDSTDHPQDATRIAQVCAEALNAAGVTIRRFAQPKRAKGTP